jgi:septal ring factor EnvC (AmiA/AmiB activator)
MTIPLQTFPVASALTNVTGGSILIAATIVALAVGLYRVSPYGKQTVDTLKDLLSATQAELAATIEQRESYREALDAAIADAHRLELLIKDREKEIAALEMRPDTTMLAAAIEHLGTGQTALLRSMEKIEEAMASNTQALVLLVDRNRDRRADD